ncbi:MAG: methylated-DNA--[protein]-cysteine S-methyltransferase [Bacteroidota bacterium]
MQKHSITYTQSPLGTLQLTAVEHGLTAINYNNHNPTESLDQQQLPVLTKTIDQLNEYFEGQRKSFDIPLALNGTKFQQKVWKQLQQISYGQTITYSELAKRLGDPQKARAVAGANGLNPIPIIIPCHRVIGVDNKLTGYSGGIKRKEFLLKLEGALLL